MDNETGEIGIIALVANIHDAVTMVIGSVADVSGIAMVYRADNLALRIIILTVVIHLTFGLVLTGTKRIVKLLKRHHRHGPIGFVPPKR